MKWRNRRSIICAMRLIGHRREKLIARRASFGIRGGVKTNQPAARDGSRRDALGRHPAGLLL